MMTSKLSYRIKREFPEVSKKYIDFLKNAKKLNFDDLYSTNYKVGKTKVTVSANEQNESETLIWALLHEIGHFLAIDKKRLIKNNYGFDNAFKPYNKKKARKHEEEVIAIQIALGNHFGLKPLKNYAIENILNTITFEHSKPATIRRRAKALNVTQLKAEFTRRNTYLKKVLK